MGVVCGRCAGLAVHKASIVAYLIEPGEVNRLQKTLAEANIQLAAVASWP